MFNRKTLDLSKLSDNELKERIEILKSSIKNFEKNDPMLPFFQNHLKRHKEEYRKRKRILFN